MANSPLLVSKDIQETLNHKQLNPIFLFPSYFAGAIRLEKVFTLRPWQIQPGTFEAIEDTEVDMMTKHPLQSLVKLLRLRPHKVFNAAYTNQA